MCKTSFAHAATLLISRWKSTQKIQVHESLTGGSIFQASNQSGRIEERQQYYEY